MCACVNNHFWSTSKHDIEIDIYYFLISIKAWTGHVHVVSLMDK